MADVSLKVWNVWNMEPTVQYLQDQIKITLSGTTELDYTIRLYDHPFMRRWLEQFKDIIKNKSVLEKNYCFLGFADSKRNLKFLHQTFLEFFFDQVLFFYHCIH